MSLIKKIGAMFMAGAMVLGLGATGAKAETEEQTVPTDGSITIKSPILGASYDAYRIFDMTRTESGDGVAYSISKDSPFYDAVEAYADVEGNGLVLDETTTEGVYNVTSKEGFEPQKFGQALEAFVASNATAVADLKYEADYSDTDNKVVTVAETDQIMIKDLPYGYYLVLGSYPTAKGTVTLKTPDGVEPPTQWKIEQDATEEQIAGIAAEYTAAVLENELNKYIAAHPGEGTGENGEYTDDDKDSLRVQLTESITENAITEIKTAIANQLPADQSDINVQTQRLVFLDSTNKNADINEKNLIDTWDVPVNPIGAATLEDLPEHDEPQGGKNIIIGEIDGKPVYANMTEANIGDTIKYQLRVNAVNFVRNDNVSDKPDAENEFAVQQVKEYILADYQSDALTFPQGGKIIVNVIDANGKDVTKKVEGGTVVTDAPDGLDYSAWASQFFIDGSDVTRDENGKVTSVLGNGGIVVPWAILTTDEDVANGYVNKTSYVKTETIEGNDPATEEVEESYTKNTTYYWCSLYDNDVTIVVTYDMVLNDKAVIDGDGNINYAQYGMNYTDKTSPEYKPNEPGNPPDNPTPKPEKERDIDEAVVKTYAAAIQKVDQDKNPLPGATFKIKGLEVTKIDNGYYKVKSYNPDSDADSEELIADDNGTIVIEGFRTDVELTVTEVATPDGYNKLTNTVTLKAKKISEVVNTNTTTTYYADEDKNTVLYKVETTSSAVTTYYDSANAKKVETDEGTKYYVADENVEEAIFNAVIGADQESKGSVKEVISNIEPEALEIVNRKGTELPETGGTGTKLFYAIGGILVAVAGVLLVSRKRMLN